NHPTSIASPITGTYRHHPQRYRTQLDLNLSSSSDHFQQHPSPPALLSPSSHPNSTPSQINGHISVTHYESYECQSSEQQQQQQQNQSRQLHPPSTYYNQNEDQYANDNVNCANQIASFDPRPSHQHRRHRQVSQLHPQNSHHHEDQLITNDVHLFYVDQSVNS